MDTCTHASLYPTIGQAGGGRTGNAVSFHVDWCPPPDPNPKHLGCYRSELALQRAVQDTLIDWRPGVGSSERWFGFSNRLRNFTYDAIGNGPSFQLHGGGGLPTLKGLHPNLNLRVEGRNCSQSNRSCPVWELGVSHGDDGAHGQRCGDDWPSCWRLGPALEGRGPLRRLERLGAPLAGVARSGPRFWRCGGTASWCCRSRPSPRPTTTLCHPTSSSACIEGRGRALPGLGSRQVARLSTAG